MCVKNKQTIISGKFKTHLQDITGRVATVNLCLRHDFLGIDLENLLWQSA